jgi:hypothetical protein
MVVAAPAYSACALTDITPTAQDCETVTGNALGGDATKIQEQQDALAALGFNWDGDWNAIETGGFKLDGLNGATTLDWGMTLYGITYIGVHFGGGAGGGFTGFYRFDADGGLDTVTLNIPSSSAAVLYHTGAVPEPISWAMMLGGFGMIGGVMRARRRTEVSFG